MVFGGTQLAGTYIFNKQIAETFIVRGLYVTKYVALRILLLNTKMFIRRWALFLLYFAFLFIYGTCSFVVYKEIFKLANINYIPMFLSV